MLLLITKEPTPKSISPGAGVNSAAVTLEALLLEIAVYVWAEHNSVLHGLTMSKLFCLAVASGKGLEVHSQYAYGCAN